MKVLLDNKTWKVVNIPDGAHLVSFRWVYIIQYKLDGLIERYKACLVTKYFNKKYEINYLETFALWQR